ncbi:MAG: hypothetical protein QXR60_00475 [Candidatus Nanoarchaeia archaeon]
MKLIKNNILIFLMVIILILGILDIIYMPKWKGPEFLKEDFPRFCLSLLSIVLLFSIGLFLLHRYKVTGKENKTTLIWAYSFFIFSLTFTGMLLHTLKIPWADLNNPHYFFLHRQWMILFSVGIYYGLMKVVTESKFLRVYLTLFILIISYFIFIFGLLILKNIDLTMSLFLYFIFSPICIMIAHFFFRYGKEENVPTMNIVSLGFVSLAIAYLTWLPWYYDYFYFICFTLFNLSLVLILVGFIYMSLTRVLEQKQIRVGLKGLK